MDAELSRVLLRLHVESITPPRRRSSFDIWWALLLTFFGAGIIFGALL